MSIAFPAEIEIVPSDGPDGQSGVASERPLLSIVIPVRDAAGSLPATLNAITRWIAESTFGAEVVVIDDGSSDGTRATASSFGRRIANLQVLRHVERRGRLEAVRTGEQAANGELIAFGRAQDLACSLASCADMMAAMLEGSDVVVMPAPPERRTTPLPAPPSRRIADSCFDWIRRKVTRTIHEPALLLCRATALRRMMVAARPVDDADPDWIALARRAKCSLTVVRRGTVSATPRLYPARTA